jgi:hypothetical protein
MSNTSLSKTLQFVDTHSQTEVSCESEDIETISVISGG